MYLIQRWTISGSVAALRKVSSHWILKRIGGFHVTQVSLIITQVKNKIAYHSIN